MFKSVAAWPLKHTIFNHLYVVEQRMQNFPNIIFQKRLRTKAIPRTAYVRANERKARLHRNIIH